MTAPTRGHSAYELFCNRGFVSSPSFFFCSCGQPLFFGGLPVGVNVTLMNGIGVLSRVAGLPDGAALGGEGDDIAGEEQSH